MTQQEKSELIDVIIYQTQRKKQEAEQKQLEERQAALEKLAAQAEIKLIRVQRCILYTIAGFVGKFTEIYFVFMRR